MPNSTLKMRLVDFLNGSVPSEQELDSLIRIMNRDIDLNIDVDMAGLLRVAAYEGYSATLAALLAQIPKEKLAQIVNLSDFSLGTLLGVAAMNGHKQCVEAILKTDVADVYYRSEDGKTALDHAANAGHTACVVAFIEYADKIGQPIPKAELDTAISAATGYLRNNQAIIDLLNTYAKVHYPPRRPSNA
jgi:ankyrin repeat protein